MNGTAFAASNIADERRAGFPPVPIAVRGVTPVYHTIEFNTDWTVDLEISPRHRLEQLRLRKGARMLAQVRPYVIETPDGPTEVADLFFADGTTAREVPFDIFSFAD